MGVRLYLGIDAGATKTHALVADQDGHVLGVGQGGPGNWEGVGLDGAYEVYARAMGEALAGAGARTSDLAAAGYALAGLDFPSDEPRLATVVERLGVPGPRALVNDTFGALRAGATRGYGVVVISGTGTTVAGCNRQGRRHRTFGEGQHFGDLGGAGDIVWLAVRAIAQAHTGRGQPTALTARFLEHYSLRSDIEFIEGICRGEIEAPRPHLAPLVFEVAAQGDEVASGVIRFAGHELGCNAAAIARQLDMLDAPFELVLAGGVFRSQSELFIGSVVEPVRAIAPRVEPVLLRTLPVAGSALLAMDADGRKPALAVHQRLAAEAAERLANGATVGKQRSGNR